MGRRPTRPAREWCPARNRKASSYLLARPATVSLGNTDSGRPGTVAAGRRKGTATDMPLLPAEPCCFPYSLLAEPDPVCDEKWWVLHTRPRTEKALARSLHAGGVPYFLPLYERTWRTGGRLQTSHLPLFPGYV